MSPGPTVTTAGYQFDCNEFPETWSLCGIDTIQPVDKTAVVEFAHNAAVDDLVQFDLAARGLLLAVRD